MPQATNYNLFNLFIQKTKKTKNQHQARPRDKKTTLKKPKRPETTVVRRPWRRPCSRARSASHRCGVRSPRARAPAPDLAQASIQNEIYMCSLLCVYVCSIYIYIYIYISCRERERERCMIHTYIYIYFNVVSMVLSIMLHVFMNIWKWILNISE